MHFVLRTKADPASTTAAARQAIHDVDPDVPLAAVETLETILNGAMAQTRFSIWLVGGFGAVSLLLACVGLYGAVSYAVGSRTKELGLRLALGASQRRILTLVLAHGLRVTVLGVVLGTAMALILMNAIGRFLYGINPTDPRTFGVVSLLLMAVALVTCYLPARRALRVDPVIAMRPE